MAFSLNLFLYILFFWCTYKWNCFLSDSLLLMYRNATDFCVLIWYPANWLSWFVQLYHPCLFKCSVRLQDPLQPPYSPVVPFSKGSLVCTFRAASLTFGAHGALANCVCKDLCLFYCQLLYSLGLFLNLNRKEQRIQIITGKRIDTSDREKVSNMPISGIFKEANRKSISEKCLKVD